MHGYAARASPGITVQLDLQHCLARCRATGRCATRCYFAACTSGLGACSSPGPRWFLNMLLSGAAYIKATHGCKQTGGRPAGDRDIDQSPARSACWLRWGKTSVGARLDKLSYYSLGLCCWLLVTADLVHTRRCGLVSRHTPVGTTQRTLWAHDHADGAACAIERMISLPARAGQILLLRSSATVARLTCRAHCPGAEISRRWPPAVQVASAAAQSTSAQAQRTTPADDPAPSWAVAVHGCRRILKLKQRTCQQQRLRSPRARGQFRPFAGTLAAQLQRTDLR
jgi:hypothetical protein